MSTHHHVPLTSPWPHDPVVQVTAYAPPDLHPDPELAARTHGRAVLHFATGPFDLNLRPTAADLRALATALLSVAADLDEATAPPVALNAAPLPPSRRHEAPRAVWPAGLTHLPTLSAVES